MFQFFKMFLIRKKINLIRKKERALTHNISKQQILV